MNVIITTNTITRPITPNEVLYDSAVPEPNQSCRISAQPVAHIIGEIQHITGSSITISNKNPKKNNVKPNDPLL